LLNELILTGLIFIAEDSSQEIKAEVDATIEVVFKTFGKKNIKGIYFKEKLIKQCI
jgi:hypothetical protein